MDGTVISDAVNLGERIESLTRHYGVRLLITDYTFNKLSDPAKYKIRMLDRIQVKGKMRPVTIYEIYDGDRDDLCGPA